MARIISVVNQKGGVGKTTTAVNVASAIAAEGRNVLLVDMDPQANASSGVGIDNSSLAQSLYDVLVHGTTLSAILVRTSIAGLTLAPSHVDLAGAAVELVPMDGREFRLREALVEVNHQYDFIFIDCPPSLGLLTINGIVASNEVLVPVQAEYYALEGLGQLLRTLELITEHLQPDLNILGAVLTMFDRRNKLSDAVFRDIYKHFPYPVFRSVIPRNVRLAEAPSHGMPITQYDASSKGARAYVKLAQEILMSSPAYVHNPRMQLFPEQDAQPQEPITNETYE